MGNDCKINHVVALNYVVIIYVANLIVLTGLIFECRTLVNMTFSVSRYTLGGYNVSDIWVYANLYFGLHIEISCNIV